MSDTKERLTGIEYIMMWPPICDDRERITEYIADKMKKDYDMKSIYHTGEDK